MTNQEHITGLLDEMIALVNKVKILLAGDDSTTPSGPVIEPFPLDTDPRAPNTRVHGQSPDGLVTGVQVAVHVKPGTRYKCVNVQLIDEANAGGQHIVKVEVINGPTPATVRMGFPYGGTGDRVGNYIPSGNEKNEFILTNKFDPPNLGPMEIVILDDQGNINSDVVGSLGLPFGHHVSFLIQFAVRS